MRFLKKNKDNIFWICVTTVIFICLWRLLGIANSFPYYTSVDYDLTYVIDSILINSGYLPVHFVTPNFGGYFVGYLTHHFASIFGYLAINNLADIVTSLNPILGVAQLVDFFRFQSPFLLVGLGVFSWLGIYLHFSENKMLNLFLLILFLVQSSFNCHVMLIRPENFSLFFWGLAFLFVSVFVKETAPGIKNITLFFIGLFVGLTFLSKIQSVIMIFSLLVILFFFDSLTGYKLIKKTRARRQNYLVFYLSFFNLLFFAAISFFAFQAKFPQQGFETSRIFHCITFQWVVVIIFFIFTFIMEIVNRIWWKEYFILHCLNKYFVLVAFGFLMVFILPCVIFPHNFSTGQLYSLLLFKVVFLGKLSPFLLKLEKLHNFGNVLFYLKLYPVTFVSIFFLMIFIAIHLNKRDIYGYSQLFLIAFLVFIGLLNVYFLLRIPHKIYPMDAAFDYTWFQNTLLIILALGLNFVIRKFDGSIIYNIVFMLLCVFLIVINISKPAVPGMNYFHERYFFFNYLPAYQELYSEKMNARYLANAPLQIKCGCVASGITFKDTCTFSGKNKLSKAKLNEIKKKFHQSFLMLTQNQNLGMDQAENYKNIQSWLNQIFSLREYSLRDVGVFSPGFFISGDEYLNDVPGELKGSIVVNNYAHIDKINYKKKYWINLLDRFMLRTDDIQIYVFVESSEWRHFIGKLHKGKILIASAGEFGGNIKRKYFGVLLNKSSKKKHPDGLNFEGLKNYFFVLKRYHK